jgi:DNA repair photolyase
MIVREIRARAVISKSRIYDYTINAYSGCQHACTYCYARFMKRFTGHKEAWGEFVDAKVNAPELLQKEIEKKTPGRVWVSGVCDPYQPLEKKYELTRQCLAILIRHAWPVTIQTRSPLVLRDLDLLKEAGQLEVALTITTGDDSIRRIFEPQAPPIQERVRALEALHSAGIGTSVMIAPMLPGAEALVDMLAGKTGSVLIDRVNYHYADWVYKKYQLQEFRNDEYFSRTSRKICSDFARVGIICRSIC